MVRAVLILLGCLVLPVRGQAPMEAGLPVFYSYGDSLVRLGEIPPAHRAMMQAELGEEVAIGYLHGALAIFWIDVWTWGGKYVLYAGDRYWELGDEQWRELLGETPKERFGVPFLHRFPPGLIVIVLLVAGGLIKRSFFPSEERRLEKLQGDPRYTAALATALGGAEAPRLRTQADDSAYRAAVLQLEGQGVKPARAEENLRRLLEAEVASRNVAIQFSLDSAEALTKEGRAPEACEILAGLVREIPPGDERRERASSLLASLEAGEGPSTPSATEGE